MSLSSLHLLDHADFAQFRRQLREQSGPSAGSYEIWKRYDASIREVMCSHGKTVGWDDGVDFYHGGDWFHELFDGFALMTTSALTVALLQDFQTVVVRHHEHASLSFGGEVSTPMRGLEVLITPTKVVAAWYKQNEVTCRRMIQASGVEIL